MAGSEVARKLRKWAWENYAPIGRDFRYHRRWLPWTVHQFVWGLARLYDRDRSRCWLHLAMWGMGFEDYRLDAKVEDGCNYCGKCLTMRTKEGHGRT